MHAWPAWARSRLRGRREPISQRPHGRRHGATVLLVQENKKWQWHRIAPDRCLASVNGLARSNGFVGLRSYSMQISITSFDHILRATVGSRYTSQDVANYVQGEGAGCDFCPLAVLDTGRNCSHEAFALVSLLIRYVRIPRLHIRV